MRDLTFTLAISALTLALTVSAAQAQVLGTGSNATGIRNLDVDGTVYDVEFLFGSSNLIYGTDPKVFDFPSVGDLPTAAAAASDAVRTALNDIGTFETVGPDGGTNLDFFDIGFGAEGLGATTLVSTGEFFILSDTWDKSDPATRSRISSDNYVYADFTVVVPEPGTALLLGLGLASLGAVTRSCGKKNDATDGLNTWSSFFL
jgi:hypothetical protein